MKTVPFIFKICLLVFLSTISYSAHAEYYIVRSASSCCEDVVYQSRYQCAEYLPCGSSIVYIRSSAPYRYGSTSAGTPMYEWVE